MFRKLFFTKMFVNKSVFANRPKSVLPKFGSDRMEVRGVNGRSKLVVAVRPQRESRSVNNARGSSTSLRVRR